jgi:hypothetical protein
MTPRPLPARRHRRTAAPGRGRRPSSGVRGRPGPCPPTGPPRAATPPAATAPWGIAGRGVQAQGWTARGRARATPGAAPGRGVGRHAPRAQAPLGWVPTRRGAAPAWGSRARARGPGAPGPRAAQPRRGAPRAGGAVPRAARAGQSAPGERARGGRRGRPRQRRAPPAWGRGAAVPPGGGDGGCGGAGLFPRARSRQGQGVPRGRGRRMGPRGCRAIGVGRLYAHGRLTAGDGGKSPDLAETKVVRTFMIQCPTQRAEHMGIEISDTPHRVCNICPTPIRVDGYGNLCSSLQA